MKRKILAGFLALVMAFSSLTTFSLAADTPSVVPMNDNGYTVATTQLTAAYTALNAVRSALNPLVTGTGIFASEATEARPVAGYAGVRTQLENADVAVTELIGYASTAGLSAIQASLTTFRTSIRAIWNYNSGTPAESTGHLAGPAGVDTPTIANANLGRTALGLLQNAWNTLAPTVSGANWGILASNVLVPFQLVNPAVNHANVDSFIGDAPFVADATGNVDEGPPLVAARAAVVTARTQLGNANTALSNVTIGNGAIPEELMVAAYAVARIANYTVELDALYVSPGAAGVMVGAMSAADVNAARGYLTTLLDDKVPPTLIQIIAEVLDQGIVWPPPDLVTINPATFIPGLAIPARGHLSTSATALNLVPNPLPPAVEGVRNIPIALYIPHNLLPLQAIQLANINLFVNIVSGNAEFNLASYTAGRGPTIVLPVYSPGSPVTATPGFNVYAHNYGQIQVSEISGFAGNGSMANITGLVVPLFLDIEDLNTYIVVEVMGLPGGSVTVFIGGADAIEGITLSGLIPSMGEDFPAVVPSPTSVDNIERVSVATTPVTQAHRVTIQSITWQDDTGAALPVGSDFPTSGIVRASIVMEIDSAGVYKNLGVPENLAGITLDGINPRAGFTNPPNAATLTRVYDIDLDEIIISPHPVHISPPVAAANTVPARGHTNVVAALNLIPNPLPAPVDGHRNVRVDLFIPHSLLPLQEVQLRNLNLFVNIVAGNTDYRMTSYAANRGPTTVAPRNLADTPSTRLPGFIITAHNYAQIQVSEIALSGDMTMGNIAGVSVPLFLDIANLNDPIAVKISGLPGGNITVPLTDVAGVERVTTWAQLQAAINNPNISTIVLGADITAPAVVGTGTLWINRAVRIEGERNLTGASFRIYDGGLLTLAGPILSAPVWNSGIHIMPGGTFTLESGTISTTYAPCVYADGGTFNMVGGNLIGDPVENFGSARSRAGVLLSGNGIFNMSGGNISGFIYAVDTANRSLGGGSTVNMTGGTITDSDRVLVRNDTSFNMQGGSISNLTAIFAVNFGGKLTMSGDAVISNVPAIGVGGEFTMDGGTITGGTIFVGEGASFTMGNNALISDSATRAVQVSGEFTMNGGIIRNNAWHGVWVGSDAIFTMNDGSIRNNDLEGVFIWGEFTMNGGNISYNNNSGVIIASAGDGRFTMNGGSVTNNSRTLGGGGGIIIDWENVHNLTINPAAVIENNVANRTFTITPEDRQHLRNLGFAESVIDLFDNNNISYTRGQYINVWQQIMFSFGEPREFWIPVTVGNLPDGTYDVRWNLDESPVEWQQSHTPVSLVGDSITIVDGRGWLVLAYDGTTDIPADQTWDWDFTLSLWTGSQWIEDSATVGITSRPTMRLGEQIGNVAQGNSGTISFPIETRRMPDGRHDIWVHEWDVDLGMVDSQIPGVRWPAYVDITDNRGMLHIQVDSTAQAGEWFFCVDIYLDIGGFRWLVFAPSTLTIDNPPPPPPTPTIQIGTQRGQMHAGAQGNTTVNFTVTTTNVLPLRELSVTVDNLPPGVSARANVSLNANGVGDLQLVGGSNTVAGVWHNLRMRTVVNGVSLVSNPFTLTIFDPHIDNLPEHGQDYSYTYTPTPPPTTPPSPPTPTYNPWAGGNVSNEVERQIAAGYETITLAVSHDAPAESNRYILALQRDAIHSILDAENEPDLIVYSGDSRVILSREFLQELYEGSEADNADFVVRIEPQETDYGFGGIDISITQGQGGNAVNITNPQNPITIEVNIGDVDVGNIHRITAITEDGARIGGRLDPETGLFMLESQAIGTFTIAYVEDLTRLSLSLDSPIIYDLADNAPTQVMDVLPVIENDRTLLPVRFMAYALGADIDWTPATETDPLTVFLTLDGQTLVIPIGQLSEELAELGMDVPAQIIDDRTMVPLRFISESFGAQVNWDGDARSIEIIK
ncbi:MAG: hypothetical protein LBE35_03625 [Clostridiales bacterium]|jgi:hypothetical protein|nr:hypothetical protein [Clostridiales bacterium]